MLWPVRGLIQTGMQRKTWRSIGGLNYLAGVRAQTKLCSNLAGFVHRYWTTNDVTLTTAIPTPQFTQVKRVDFKSFLNHGR